MKSLIRKLIRYLAFRTGYFRNWYLKICRPGSEEFASYMKVHGKLYAMGNQCRINPYVTITEPAYVSVGNNVTLSKCYLMGRNEEVDMLRNAYHMTLDSSGKIVIKDNVFVGHGVIVKPNVTIGSNVVVAAGALVDQDVADGLIVGGVPAKPIGRTDDLVHSLEEKTASYPWASIIKNRQGSFDPTVEEILVQMRVKYFFPENCSISIICK